MNVTFDATTRHQTIDNFGASQAWWVDIVGDRFPAEAMEEIADLLFGRERGIGLSCTRFNIGGGSVWYDTEYIENWFMRAECFQRGPNAPYDWTRHAGQRRLLELARERGVERTIAFVNSPPAWMTASGHTRGDDRTGTTNLRFGREREFARFLADVLAHFRDIDMPFDYISPVNEPQVPWDFPKQEGCRYSNQDMSRAVIALREVLDAEGLDTPILFNETNTLFQLIDLDIAQPFLDRIDPDGGYRTHAFRHGGKYFEGLKDVFSNPEVASAIAPVVAAHSYGTDSPETIVEARRMTRATMERYPGYDYWMTEYCILGEYGPKRDLGIDPALVVANVVHHDLVHMDAAAWQWWLGVSGGDYKDGLVYLDLDEQRVLASKMLWALGHWSRFLRPGSVRVGLSATAGEGLDTGDLLASAYLDAEGSPVVVVVNHAHEPTSIAVDGAPAASWRVWRTDAERDLADTGSASGAVEIGPRSIVTLVGR
ncbi:MAG: glycoside hydrolase family 30 protein [Spirochaetota bacterium]